MEVWKDIFRSGRYRDQAGTVHTFTDSDVREAHANAVKMLTNGGEAWTPPAIFEHDWTSVPVPISTMLSIYETDRDRRADTARNCFGHLKAVKLETENGRPVLWGLHYIHDPKDAAAWKAARYCSPRIDWNTVDPLGRRYPGAAIVHVAATTRPIQIDQKPVLLSAWKPGTRSLLLSKDDVMAKEDDDAAAAGSVGESGSLARLKAALAEAGRPIPDGAVTLEDICLAIESQNMAANPDAGSDLDNDGMDDDADADAGKGATTNSVSPAMLSALTPEQRPAVEAGMNALALATTRARGGYLKRLAKVEAVAVEKGLYTPPKMAALKAKLTGVSLSFLPATGEVVKNAAINELELLENAVRNVAKATGTNDAGKGKKPKTVSVSLSGFGGPAPADAENLEASIKAAAQAAADRVSPRDATATAAVK